MNLLLIGHRQHGKSDIGKLLAKALGVVAHDSSLFAAEHVVYPQLRDLYGYASPEEAYNDRDNHRQEWFEIIQNYNSQPDRLTRAILKEGNIYIGMRSRWEFEGSKRHFDHVIWVDASQRVPEEPKTSMELTQADADYVLDNNGTKADIPVQISRLLTWLAQRIPKEQQRVLVYGIAPEHHLARGTLGEYILEQIISGNEEEVVKQLGELYGPGTDKKLSPAHLRNTLETNHFEDSRAMGNYDQVSLVTNNPDGVSIVAVDPSTYETSFNNLQKRVGDWADETFAQETDGPKFDLLVDSLRSLVEEMKCPEDFAEAMLILMQGMNEAGFKMHEDIMPAAYRQMEIMKRRVYYVNDHGDLQYTTQD